MTTLTAQADALAATVGVYRLDDVTIVRVSGDDRRTWLNGQLTNDVRATHAGDAVYALVIHLSGKILTDLFVLDRGDDLALAVPTSTADAVLEQLGKYIIMEDVELERVTDLAALSAQGPAAHAAIELAAIPSAQAFPCDRLGAGGYDVLVPQADVEAAFLALCGAAEALGGSAVDAEARSLAATRSGRPRFGIDFGDRQYPQEAGLRERALSFGKGCYLGQEIVCTLESQGQLVRKLVLLDAETAPAPGSVVTLADGTEVGSVTSSIVDPATGRALAFAYLKRGAAVVAQAVRLEDRDATVTRVLVTTNV